MVENLIGRSLGKYELRERLGSGGMAEVYKGYHSTLARYVAIKILHPFLREDATFKERFEREAQNVAKLRHPNIVQVYDFDQDLATGLYYMVMEYIDGPPMDSYLVRLESEGKWLPLPEAIRVIREIGQALSYAHRQDMVHRDLKPANVMIDSDGRIVLTDFGIARMITGPQMTASGTMIGTPAYMSPEQGLGQHVDHRSDIYSLGIMLYQLATRKLPFMADTPIAIVLQHVNEPVPPPSEIALDIPQGLERIIFKALAKLPDERYQSIDEMTAHLNNFESAATLAIPQSTISGRAVSAATVRPDIAAVSTPARRGIGLLPVIGGGLVILAVVVGLFFLAVNGWIPGNLVPMAQTATPTSTPTATPHQDYTATPDQQATINALAATSQALAVPSATPTPDLTATAIACAYDYSFIVSGEQRPDHLPFTQEITIINDSRCMWGPGTRLAFVEGEQMEAPAAIELDSALNPGDGRGLEIPFVAPDMAVSGSEIRSVWQIELPDGTRIGPPIVMEISLYDSDVLLTPAATDTPEPTPTPTQAAEAPPLQLNTQNWIVQNCHRRPEQPIDYVCTVELYITGGQPPYTVTSEGIAYTFEAPPYAIHVGGRTEPECTNFPWTVIVSDRSGQVTQGNYYFSVNQYYSAFTDGACP